MLYLEKRYYPCNTIISLLSKDPSPKAWEALLVGTIPVIEHSTLDDAYSQLPVRRNYLLHYIHWSSIFVAKILLTKLLPDLILSLSMTVFFPRHSFLPVVEL